MAQSLVAEDPSSSKITARSANKWSSNGRGRHTISALYYVMVPSIGLFTTTKQKHLGHKKVRGQSEATFLTAMCNQKL